MVLAVISGSRRLTVQVPNNRSVTHPRPRFRSRGPLHDPEIGGVANPGSDILMPGWLTCLPLKLL